MNTFHLRIVTMDGKVFDDQASQIFLRTIDGDVAIRAGHINYCSGIGMGQAHVTLADGHALLFLNWRHRNQHFAQLSLIYFGHFNST